MGCDIHLYKEKNVNGKWLTADEWETEDYGDGDVWTDVPWEERFTGRNYNLFGLLSKGVRRHIDFGFEPRGIPLDASDEVREKIESYGCDGHSHSYLYLHELKSVKAFMESHSINISGMKRKDQLTALNASIASGAPDWNLLYPYCQDTNSPDYEEFSIDVPSCFIIGNDIDEIISSFDGIDGDNHRIVFFFDN